MKFLVVSSPHAYTTRDVWKRVCVGLAAHAEVQEYDLLPRYGLWEFVFEQARKHKLDLPPGMGVNTMACEPVFGAAHYYDADMVIVVSPQYFPMSVIDLIRKSGIKTAAYFTEAPYEDTLNSPVQASHFDYVFVNDRNSVSLFQSFCDHSFYLPHSFDPAIHYPGDGERDDRVLFIGTGYPSRRQFFQQIDWTGLNLDLRGIWWLPSRSKLRPFRKGDIVENEDLAEEYRKAAVGISMHRQQRFMDAVHVIDDEEAYSVGPRTYELAACGLFQVSDFRQELVDLFGDAVPIYETPGQLQSLLRKAVADPVWREEMAARQQAAVRGHTCQERMRIVMEAVA